MIKKNITGFIEKLLFANPSLRDDYARLYCYVICYEMGLTDFSKMEAFSRNHTLYDYFQGVLKKQISAPETTRRTWQKLQEENPELAGEQRAERKRHAGVVKQEIKEVGQKSLFN